jgi:predicted nuclease with TOPRIM domain
LGDGNEEEGEEEMSREELEERVRQMEGEQEELTGSLQALTSHYARLQLRLQQVPPPPHTSV